METLYVQWKMLKLLQCNVLQGLANNSVLLELLLKLPLVLDSVNFKQYCLRGNNTHLRKVQFPTDCRSIKNSFF